MAQADKKTPGRPAGSRNRQYATVAEFPARCPICGSTDREPYQSGPFNTLDHAGVTATGQPFTRTEWRRTRCAGCGQHLIIRRHLNQSLPPSKDGSHGQEGPTP